jgi:methylmalonyl-CoA carboxyltransferase small subunit
VKLKLTVDGKLYEVDVEVAEPEHPAPGYIPPVSPIAAKPTAGASAAAPRMPSATPGGGAAAVDESKVCRSPIAGVVVRLAAEVGQQIKANDVLMLLEAMKMETVITSPMSGTIAKINANVGDSVKSGQVLVEFN